MCQIVFNQSFQYVKDPLGSIDPLRVCACMRLRERIYTNDRHQSVDYVHNQMKQKDIRQKIENQVECLNRFHLISGTKVQQKIDTCK